MKDKKIGLVSCAAIVAGNLIGSSIALLPANLAALGSITFISWIFASAGAVALAFVYAKLSAKNPEQGGPVAYAGQVAPILGYQTGVLYFNANWIGNLAIAMTGVAYCSQFFPVLKHALPAGITTIAVIWLFTIINLFGAQWIGRLVSITIALLLVPVLFTGIIGWHWFKVSLFVNNWNYSGQSNLHAVFSGTILCLWSFMGVESAAVNSKLVRNPEKTIPMATMLGVSVSAIVYFLSCTVISGLFPASVVAHSSSPFSLVLEYMLGTWASHIATIIIAFASLVALSSWMMLLAQAAVRAANDGTLPKIFAKQNDNEVPVAGLLIIALMMSVTLLLLMVKTGSANQLFQEIITIAVLLTILPYFYSVLNLISVAENPIKNLLVAVAALIAVMFCFSAYIGSQHYALVSVVIVSLISFIFYVRKDRSDFEKSIHLSNIERRSRKSINN